MLARMIRAAVSLSVTGLVAFGLTVGARAQKSDGEWPRVINNPKAKVTVYQPQIESFDDVHLAARAAVSVTEPKKDPVFGAVWFDARVSVDKEARVVTLLETKVTEAKFPNATDEQTAGLKRIIEAEIPNWGSTMSYDDLVAGLAAVEEEKAASERLNNAPPEIIFATKASVLIMIDGEPIVKPVEGSNLKSVVNTPFFIVQEPSAKLWYLKGKEAWYSALDVKGPWDAMKQAPPAPVVDLAAKMVSKPPEEEKEEGPPVIPAVIVRTKPAELIQCDGEPKYEPVKDTPNLLYVKNSESDIVMDITSQQHFVLIAGRWYSSKSLADGPWVYVPGDKLPADFAKIPAGSDLSTVRASVPGTQESKEAVLENSIPQTAEVDRKTATVTVTYDGDPKFEKIEGTSMSYAVNTDKSVLLISSRYYCCDQAIWFESPSPKGPWAVSTAVPADVKSIPPESPVYNVKYVYIYDSTPEVVYVGYTPAYCGSYVYGGCVVYGTGYYYHPWYGAYYYPRPVTYGFHACYNPYTGWGMSFGVSYGWFSVSFGGYGGYWGPAGYAHGYNHGYAHGYHHGYNQGYGHGYAAGYRQGQNAGNRPAQYSNNPYKNRESGVKPTSRPSTQPATRPGAGQGATARPSTKQNNVYADKSGNVYRKSGDQWQQRTDNGWSSGGKPSSSGAAKQSPATKQQPSATRPAQPSHNDLNKQYQARERSTQRTQGYNKSTRSAPSRSGSRGGGGGRHR